MIPRASLDIEWTDLLAATGYSVLPGGEPEVRERLEARWSPAGDAVACLSVRSGFDLTLQALALPTGSEVLTSALTIPNMVRLMEWHGLVPVPLDLDPATLSIEAAAIDRAVTPCTRAVLAAPLFGCREPLDAVAEAARRHSLLLLEDCAQAYDGSGYRGHPEADVSMFSFGPIKPSTALGGALLRFRDGELRKRVIALQSGYPLQSRRAYLARIARFAVLKGLAEPRRFSLFTAACRAAKIDYDRLLREAVRGFSGPDLVARLRRRPCAPLLRLLDRRIRSGAHLRIQERERFTREVRAALPEVSFPGSQAGHRAPWLLPIESDEPDALVHLLRKHGFDATRGASSLIEVPAPADRPELHPARAAALLRRLVYLPMYPRMTARDIARLIELIIGAGLAEGRRE